MGTLRVISGTAKGIRIQTVPGDSTRPITDRAKESLFNIISYDVIDSTWLDCFGGTGSVSIEALSRGAKFATIIDSHPLAIQIIKKNLLQTKLNIKSEVLRSDSLIYIRNQSTASFDYIFVAPPQYKEIWIKTLTLLDENPKLLSEDGWIIVQIHPIEYKKMDFKNFSEIQQRKYGSTLFVIYQKPIE
ncbi:MAG TPA: 16S rRNA (guanine(966)-N(2))-methyltransferase RsmD [Anaerolineaceae bacterium]|nr:16S rRNA (guanine(966)-N(2))-methyltransferase RsmD [Anaerolineaceae bacterium]